MDNHRTETSLEDRSILKREKRFKSQRPKECGRPVENVTRNRLTQEGQLLIFMKKSFFNQYMPVECVNYHWIRIFQ